jgi:hypothetical protein
MEIAALGPGNAPRGAVVAALHEHRSWVPSLLQILAACKVERTSKFREIVRLKAGDGGLVPPTGNRSRLIQIAEIAQILVTNGIAVRGVKLPVYHPKIAYRIRTNTVFESKLVRHGIIRDKNAREVGIRIPIAHVDPPCVCLETEQPWVSRERCSRMLSDFNHRNCSAPPGQDRKQQNQSETRADKSHQVGMGTLGSPDYSGSPAAPFHVSTCCATRVYEAFTGSRPGGARSRIKQLCSFRSDSTRRQMAGRLGIEPRLKDPKTSVLPLHHRPKRVAM